MKTVRIAGVQGFYGDSPLGALAVAMSSAADYLMQDALSELTLSILQKDKLKDPEMGYARDIELYAKKLYPLAFAQGIRIVSNSGGLNPHAAARKVLEILKSQGIEHVKIAVIDGDDFMGRLDELKNSDLPLLNMDSGDDYRNSKYEPTHANVYIGAKSVKEALDKGANLILAGRVADPCLALGILSHEFGWNLEGELSQDELNKLANGIMVGHILECGGQASGGNAYSEWSGRNYDFSTLGYPIAHVQENGTATITKVEGSGGKISRNTIREQLVYEIHNPAAYITPDVTVDFTSIGVEEAGPDMVKVYGAKGLPKPEQLKLCVGQMEGYLSEQIFYFSWPYAYDKALAFEKAAREIWDMLPFKYDEIRINYLGLNGIHEEAAPKLSTEFIEQMNEIGLRIAIKHKHPDIGKMMIQAVVSLGLNGPPGIAASMNWGKSGSIRLGLFPILIPRELVVEKVTIY
jgi:hypothetical protein